MKPESRTSDLELQNFEPNGNGTVNPGLGRPRVFRRWWATLDTHMQEVVNQASIALALRLIGAGLAIGFNLLLARMLGAEGAGVYFLALTVTTIAAVFGRMGLDNALLRFVAASASIGDWAAVKGVYRKGIALAVIGSAAAALLIFIAAPWLAARVFGKPELIQPIRWMAFAIVPLALLMLHGELLKGLKQIRDSQLAQVVAVPTLSLFGLYLMGPTWGVTGAVWAYAVAVALTAVIGFGLWRTATPQLREAASRFEMTTLLGSSLPLFWVSLVDLVMSGTSTFILGVWGSSADVGIFGVASRTAMLISFILVAVNTIAAPKFAALYKQGDMKALGATARTSARWMSLLAAPVLLLFILAPAWVMGIFGPQFVSGAGALAVLSVGQFVNVATGSVGYLLIMSGQERLMRNNMTITAVLNLSLNLWLVPQYGIIGAVIATAIAVSCQNLYAAYLVYRTLGINTIFVLDLLPKSASTALKRSS